MEEVHDNERKMDGVIPSADSSARHLTIKLRMVILLLVTLLPILLAQAYSYYDRFQASRKQQLHSSLEMARAVAKSFNGFIENVLHQELAIGIAATASRPLETADFQRLLDESAVNEKSVRSFNWISPQGIILASSMPESTGLSVANRAYFQEILSGREWNVSDLLRTKPEEQPGFIIYRAVRDARGALLGAVTAVIYPDGLDETLAIERFETGGISLKDRRGMLVYRYPHIYPSWKERNWLESQPHLKRALEGEEVETMARHPYEKHPRLMGESPVESIGWVAGAGVREEEVMKPILTAILHQAGIFLGIAIASFACAFFLSRSIALPVERLRRQALALGEGDFVAGIEPDGPAELRDLAKGFAEMARQVRFWMQTAHERALEAEERKGVLDAILKQMPAGVFIGESPSGRLVEHNRQAREIWRYPGDAFSMDLQEREPLAFQQGFHRDGKPYEVEEWPLVRSIRRGETVVNEEIQILRVDGTMGMIRKSARPVYGEDGRLVAGVAVFHDITDQKRMEDELRRSRDDLELRVAERTEELARTNRILEQRNRDLSDFNHIAAHDLQEPLRLVVTFADRLAREYGEVLDERGLDFLKRMQRAAGRMRTLIRDILEYSLLSSRAQPPTATDLNRVVRDVIDDLEDLVEKKDAIITAEELPTLDVDREQISRVFRNLIGNALKFAGDDEPMVRIHAEPTQDRKNCRIFVEDNGLGFDMAYLHKIFTPLQRLHPRSRFEGSGIGLAVCRKVMELHGGSITAKSRPGEGATFILSLPMSLVDDCKPSAEPRRAALPKPCNHGHASM